MASILSISSRRSPAKLLIGGALLLAVASYVASRVNLESDPLGTPTASRASESTSTSIEPQTYRLPSQSNGVAGANGAALNAAGSQIAIFTPDGAVEGLRAFFDKILKQENLSPEDIDSLQERMLASIENEPGVADAVARFYKDMPAEQRMERDMLRTLLLHSEVGRGIVLQEANATWESKSEAKFAEMYETYFNLPGRAPPEVLARALADVKKGLPTDDRTAIARLNFIGDLQAMTLPDAANARSEALQLLNRLADGQSSELVKALAVQKLYRLNSPAEASNIAIAQLSKGAYPDLVRETLASVASGDVEITPTLRAALTTAVSRPGALAEEKQQLKTVLGVPR